jgi:hypothetical protein
LFQEVSTEIQEEVWWMEERRIQTVCKSSKEVCKEMSKKILSLRGVIEDVPCQTGVLDSLLFEYESNDLKKGWKVIDAKIWITKTEFAADTNYRSAKVAIRGQLQTDIIGDTSPEGQYTSDPSDNRAIGWMSASYECDANTATGKGFFIPYHDREIVDPDHVITRELRMSTFYDGHSGLEGEKVNVGYLIVLEKQKITDAEFVLQTVKGIAQDIFN